MVDWIDTGCVHCDQYLAGVRLRLLDIVGLKDLLAEGMGLRYLKV
jgi:hypothetical protein